MTTMMMMMMMWHSGSTIEWVWMLISRTLEQLLTAAQHSVWRRSGIADHGWDSGRRRGPLARLVALRCNAKTHSASMLPTDQGSPWHASQRVQLQSRDLTAATEWHSRATQARGHRQCHWQPE
eukprot:3710327-Rhodomonas_salina.2